MFGESWLGFLTGVVVVLVLVLLNGFFVAAEFAIVKVRSTQIDALVRRGKALARAARIVVKKLDSYLSATQLGITLTSLALGWVGKPAVEVFVRIPLRNLGFSDDSVATVAFAISFGLITFLHIVLGELVPKSLAIQRPEGISLVVAAPLIFFYRLTYPAIWLLDRTAQLMIKPLGLRPMAEHELGYSEEELRLLLLRSPEKEVTHLARNLALRALELRRRTVREIIIPRRQIAYLSTRRGLQENLRVARESGFTRFPICEESLDHTIGMVNIRDVLWSLQGGAGSMHLAAYKREMLYIPETLPLEEMLSRFLRTRLHMALVLDEYGGTIGMVTLEDVLEELVGEIQDEFDQETPPVAKLPGPPEAFLAEGSVPLYQLNSFTGLSLKSEGVDTLSGYLIKALGRIPASGEEIPLAGVRYTIKKVGRRRIHQVEIRRMGAGGSGGE